MIAPLPLLLFVFLISSNNHQDCRLETHPSTTAILSGRRKNNYTDSKEGILTTINGHHFPSINVMLLQRDNKYVGVTDGFHFPSPWSLIKEEFKEGSAFLIKLLFPLKGSNGIMVAQPLFNREKH